MRRRGQALEGAGRWDPSTAAPARRVDSPASQHAAWRCHVGRCAGPAITAGSGASGYDTLDPRLEASLPVGGVADPARLIADGNRW